MYLFLIAILALQIIHLIKQIKMKEFILQLQEAVRLNTSATKSVAATMHTLADKLDNAADAGDLDAVKELAAEIRANNADLAAAITEGTAAAGDDQEESEEAEG